MRFGRMATTAAVMAGLALGALAGATPARAWWHGGYGWGWRGGIGLGFTFAPPPVYFPPAYYAPPAYFAPPVYPAPPVYAPPPVYYSQPDPEAASPQTAPALGTQNGSSCYAGPYVCPIDRPILAGSLCSCPGNNGPVRGQVG